MNSFEKKYGQIEDKRIKDFHKSRRMFAIYKNRLYIAKKGVDYSHAVWFVKTKWITIKNNELMDKITRGIVDSKGDVYFYKGYDFRIDKIAEKEMFSHLNKLTKKLKLNSKAKVYGGYLKKKLKEENYQKKYMEKYQII